MALAREDVDELQLAMKLVEVARPWTVPVGRLPALTVRVDASPTGLGIVALEGLVVRGVLFRRFTPGEELLHIIVTKRQSG